MTRDEVMAMTDDELRIKAARLLGATKFLPDRESGTELEGYWPEDDEGCGEGWQTIPDYPNDIAAAWELVDAMMARGIPLALFAPGSVGDEGLGGGLKWEAQFQMGGEWFKDGAEWFKGYDENKAARAITRAFVLAMESA
jgi:hypothetical protein